MANGKVIEARVWKHSSGRTASVHGAVPWTTEAEKLEWSMQTVGYTIQHPDGTVGLGRKPFATKTEAEAWVTAHPRFRGMSQD
jgi:hypothetical protein